METNQKRWMNVQETADYLGLTTKAVYNRVHMQRIPYTKLGGSLRFNRELLDSWLQSQTVKPREKDMGGVR